MAIPTFVIPDATMTVGYQLPLEEEGMEVEVRWGPGFWADVLGAFCR